MQQGTWTAIAITQTHDTHCINFDTRCALSILMLHSKWSDTWQSTSFSNKWWSSMHMYVTGSDRMYQNGTTYSLSHTSMLQVLNLCSVHGSHLGLIHKLPTNFQYIPCSFMHEQTKRVNKNALFFFFFCCCCCYIKCQHIHNVSNTATSRLYGLVIKWAQQLRECITHTKSKVLS